MEYKNDIINEQDELNSQEYLGTFRWKFFLQFPKLTSNLYPYPITKWADYIGSRLDFEFEPYIVDALSYPLSIIHALHSIKDDITVVDNTINLILIGTSAKAEGRIAYESNYFDEIYHYLKIMTGKDFQLKIYLSGPEMQGNFNLKRDDIKYIFYKGKTGDFLKEYVMEFNKSNTYIIGLNCGFGAGFLRLTLSWVNDLIKLLKLGYPLIFTYTNDYEDMKGELAIFENLLKAVVISRQDDNPFKSMTTYKNDEEQWACGNYGYYMVKGSDKNRLNELSKYSQDKIKEEVEKVFRLAGIKIKNQ
jgi:hypothetical protein